jgi:3-oxoacyl-[acyl-carrier-protein] synthase II
LGAAGGLEAVVMAKTIESGKVHITANLENQDPKCDLELVSGSAREGDIRYALSNSFGFGGTNAAIIMKKA